ncbi:hypothetical protein NMA58_24190 (plasmid) [Rhizobium sp. YTUHZ045]|uniref:hypothetical protein n=1 Tax=Rhizobium sp. YTUHZ045 TaxID=2962888 RepID=UPI003DA9CFAB
MYDFSEENPYGCIAAAPDFWSDTDVEDASSAARSLYGGHAKTAAAWCAICARFDGRAGDFMFWVRVFRRLDLEKIGAAQSYGTTVSKP